MYKNNNKITSGYVQRIPKLSKDIPLKDEDRYKCAQFECFWN